MPAIFRAFQLEYNKVRFFVQSQQIDAPARFLPIAKFLTDNQDVVSPSKTRRNYFNLIAQQPLKIGAFPDANSAERRSRNLTQAVTSHLEEGHTMTPLPQSLGPQVPGLPCETPLTKALYPFRYNGRRERLYADRRCGECVLGTGAPPGRSFPLPGACFAEDAVFG